MLLYDVTYPSSRDMDSKVGWTYLQGLAAKERKHEGAEATCVNGEGCYVLRNGEWVDAANATRTR